MPYLVFKKPRSLQVFRMHELSLCLLCFGITLVRVRHNPKSSAAPLTPCLPASDALLLCQTTVICDWAPIDRTTALSPAEINAVTSSLLPGSMLTPLKPDGSRAICFPARAEISQRSWRVGSFLAEWRFSCWKSSWASQRLTKLLRPTDDPKLEFT